MPFIAYIAIEALKLAAAIAFAWVVSAAAADRINTDFETVIRLLQSVA